MFFYNCKRSFSQHGQINIQKIYQIQWLGLISIITEEMVTIILSERFNQIYTISYIIIDMNTKHELQLMRTNSNTSNILCQICSNYQTDLFFCQACYCFTCTACIKIHTCFDEHKQIVSAPQFQKIEKKSTKVELKKKNSESSKINVFYLSGSKKVIGISCQRCFGVPASKECRECKIKFYCQSCFKMIHSNNKLYHHLYVQIKDKQEGTAANDYKVKVTEAKNSNSKQIQDKEHKSHQNQCTLDTLKSNLSIARDALTLDYTNYQNQTCTFLHSIQLSFEQLVEEVRLKMFSVTNKIKECQQNNSKIYQQGMKLINQQLNNITNLRTITQQQHFYLLPADLIPSKLEKNNKKIQQTIKQKHSFPYQKLCIQISDEIQQIKSKVQKIELKKIVHFQGNKSSLNDSVCQSDKNTSQSHKNETKKLKTFLNLNSYKSTDKLTPLQLGLTSPKKVNTNLKNAQHFFPTINKSLFIETLQSPSQHKQKEIDKCETMKNIQSAKQKQQKYFVANLMSPKTTKKIDKNIQNSSKSNLTKAGIKIEKTKKMINEIRSEMMEFTNRFTFEKQGSKTSLQMNGDSLDISQISIQSFKTRQDQ